MDWPDSSDLYAQQACLLTAFHTQKGLCPHGSGHVTGCSLEASCTRKLSLQTLASQGLGRSEEEHLSQN